MGIIKTNYGEPSYSLSSGMVSVFITVQGGHMTASFRQGEKSSNPFFTAPWWNEAKNYDTDPAVKILK